MSPEADYLIPDIPAFRHPSPSIKHTRKRGEEVCLPYKGRAITCHTALPPGKLALELGWSWQPGEPAGQPSGSWVIPPISKSYFVTGDAVSIIMAFVASLSFDPMFLYFF